MTDRLLALVEKLRAVRGNGGLTLKAHVAIEYIETELSALLSASTPPEKAATIPKHLLDAANRMKAFTVPVPLSEAEKLPDPDYFDHPSAASVSPDLRAWVRHKEDCSSRHSRSGVTLPSLPDDATGFEFQGRYLSREDIAKDYSLLPCDCGLDAALIAHQEPVKGARG